MVFNNNYNNKYKLNDNESLLENNFNIQEKKCIKEQQKQNDYVNFREDKIECKHYNYARIFFFLGLLLYFPLIYSIMYIQEPNKHIRRYSIAAILPLIIYPSFLILITFTSN
ncbi:hypothetical protein RB653_000242 [Dictyostelium firmibasis]|uniref:Transmembrane protein n=1 Tax=Dictyostelium firmibasis TaxID=79012 RepID=A0AAN7U1Z2_9MYCE